MGKASTAAAVAIAVAVACGAGVALGNVIAGSPGEPKSQLADAGSAPAATSAAHTPKGVGDGTWRVPDEVRPGTYVTTVPEGGLCSWERLRGFTGGAEDLIDIGVGESGTRMRVTVKKSDAGFRTTDCGTWKPAKP